MDKSEWPSIARLVVVHAHTLLYTLNYIAVTFFKLGTCTWLTVSSYGGTVSARSGSVENFNKLVETSVEPITIQTEGKRIGRCNFILCN